ncbi:MAG: hypothetical protein OIN66_01550 [Candidatus Methanoperedens sp.]|nr:hypothetical protein [Candidatus Methanoperedens sp.]
MKHKFVVDENIFYCAIKCVDEYENKDFSSARFITLLQKNCHKMHFDRESNHHYEKNLQNKLESISLKESDLLGLGIAKIIQDIVHNSEKTIREYSGSMQFPNENELPHKDVYIVRCANYFSAKIVTLDKDLRDTVNAHAFLKQKGVKALHPKDAIKLASES